VMDSANILGCQVALRDVWAHTEGFGMDAEILRRQNNGIYIRILLKGIFANMYTNIDKATYVRDVLGLYLVQMKEKIYETFMLRITMCWIEIFYI
jgi:hypothetical protein